LDEVGGFTDSGKCLKNGSFPPEWVATLARNGWQLSTGIGGSFTPEYAVGYTALMGASDFGHIEIVELLIKAGADLNAHTVDRCTALSLALKARHTEIVKLLKKAGAKE